MKVAVYVSDRFDIDRISPSVGWEPGPVWSENLTFNDNTIFCKNFEEYRTCTADVKIAFDIVIWHLNSESDWQSVVNREYHRIQRIDECSNVCFVTETEIYQPSFLIQPNYSFKNVTWIIPGQVDGVSNTICWHYHIQRIVNLNKKFESNLLPYTSKEKYFEALMGGSRYHRTFVNQKIIDNNLENKFIKTLYDVDNTNVNEIKLEPGMSQARVACDVITFRGVQTALCNVIPNSVYNQTAFSVLTETGALNNIHFLTEKTAKLMLGKRLFVAFSGKGFLKFLKQCGFKTFDSIIDETYDSVNEDHERWTAAFEQVKWLCNQPQDLIFKQIKSITEHNYQHVQTNFDQEAINKLQILINQYLKL